MTYKEARQAMKQGALVYNAGGVAQGQIVGEFDGANGTIKFKLRDARNGNEEFALLEELHPARSMNRDMPGQVEPRLDAQPKAATKNTPVRNTPVELEGHRFGEVVEYESGMFVPVVYDDVINESVPGSETDDLEVAAEAVISGWTDLHKAAIKAGAVELGDFPTVVHSMLTAPNELAEAVDRGSDFARAMNREMRDRPSQGQPQAVDTGDLGR